MIRTVFVSDTHLGFDEPERPRVERRRRGPDFWRSFDRARHHAAATGAHALLHGGDVFFRSKVPASLVDRVYARFVETANAGVPVVVIPGNHERSALPPSLFLSHPNIHVLDRPRWVVLETSAGRLAVAGFPFEREAKRLFPRIAAALGDTRPEADAHVLLMHQAVEGVTCGPADFTFGPQPETIRARDLPSGFDMVLCGHIHRAQSLAIDNARGDRVRVLYTGSAERTSFAERDEEKGFCELHFPREGDVDARFVPLATRPMVDVALPPVRCARSGRRALRGALRGVHLDAVVRVHPADDESRRVLSAALLRATAPRTMTLALKGTPRRR
jgi:DNA repair exonuclease SbcCD nuclease subunit